MSFVPDFDPEAELNYWDAYEWYAHKSPGLADRFEHSVQAALNLIVKAPLHYPNKKQNYRECKIENFPYLIVYKILSDKNIIYISSIFHTSRNPWKKYHK